MRSAKVVFSVPKLELVNGGTRSHLKERRTFNPKRPMHLVLKAAHAHGDLSLLTRNNQKSVHRILKSSAQTFRVRIHEWVNIGNHLHLKIRAHDRKNLQSFLRAVPGLIARAVTGARRGKPFRGAKGTSAIKLRFWTTLVFTRVIASFYEEKLLAGFFNTTAKDSAGREREPAFLALTPTSSSRRNTS